MPNDLFLGAAPTLDYRKRAVWCGRCSLTITHVPAEYADWDSIPADVMRRVDQAASNHMQERHGGTD